MKRKLLGVGMIILLSVMLCGCSNQQGSSEPNKDSETGSSEVTEEILAEAMDLSSYAEIPDNAIQEFWRWSQGGADVVKRKDKSVNYWDYEDETADAYLKFLTKEMGLLLQETETDYRDKTYGFMHPDIEAEGISNGGVLSKKYPIVYEDYRNTGRNQGYFLVNEDVFTICDMGYRKNGEREEVKVYGDSAGAALIKTSDGVYKTDDGRLQTKLNEAMVIRDGVTSVAEAYHEIIDTEERLFVEFYYRDEGFYLEVPKYYSLTGDIYLLEDLVQRHYPTNKRDNITDVDFEEKLTFLMSYDDAWEGPKYKGNKYKQLTVRVMYYEKNVEAVYYVYAKFADEEPTEVEALVAVDLSPKQEEEIPSTEVDTSEVIKLKDGDTLLLGQTGEISYGSRKSDSAYHVYYWSVVEGKDLVILDEGHDSCRITARGKGKVVVKCSYHYTVEKENVLTGREEDAPESDTKRFDIIIK